MIHEDMRVNFKKYPQLWEASRADRNIDHRRVPNITKWLTRNDKSLKITNTRSNYKAGDIIAWKSGKSQHIGILSDKKNSKGNLMIIHNIGKGAVYQDCLFSYDKIIGHFRFFKR